MAVNQELTGFLKEGFDRGLSREQLEEILSKAGWPPDQVRVALGRFADVEFPIPVPRPKPYLFAREAFVYLVLFSTLYVSAFNLGGLLFQFIDRAFPDPAVDPAVALAMSREAIRWSISLLVAAFPVFLLVARANERTVRRDPIRRLSAVRRWLTYVTLFIAASILIGDVTSIVYNLLGGEVTIRFALKVLTVGAIAGSVFLYFHRDLRKEDVPQQGSRLGSVLLAASVTTVIMAVVAGLFVLGSPMEERARRVDRRRVADLQGIVAATDLYWTRHSRLPASLDELNAEPGVSIRTGDPASSELYGYLPLDSIQYEVCASFERETEGASRDRARNFWVHGSGRQCFQLEAKAVPRNEVGQTPAPGAEPEAPSPATRQPR